jgi:serine phosphatase RsbU (regulator of sigma subunit)
METEILAQIPFFASLPPSELAYLAGNLSVEEIEPGTVLFYEGAPGDIFYLIIRGEIEVWKAQDTPEANLLAVRGPGEFIGEISLFNPDGLRTATACARTAVSVWKINRDEFNSLLHRQPTLAFELVRVLGSRLTSAHNQALEDMYRKNQQLTQAYEALKAAQSQLVEKERLERELQLAHQIQMSILPRQLPQVARFDFGMRMLPARRVGGDFYDIFPLQQEQVGVLVGDVSDKGLPSALYMARAHALLYAEASHGASPTRVLERLNRHLLAVGTQRLFVTALYGILDCRRSQFVYTRAGHELPILLTRQGEVTLAPFRQGQLLGLLDEPVFDEQALTIPPGGTLLLYSDGATDGRDPQGELYSMPRFLEEVRRLAGLPAQQLCDQLLEALIRYHGVAQQDDDITLLAVHRQD